MYKRWALIPDEPFSNVSTSPRLIVHPMRGSSTNPQLTSRMSGLKIDALTEMQVGEDIKTRHGVVRRIA